MLLGRPEILSSLQPNTCLWVDESELVQRERTGGEKRKGNGEDGVSQCRVYLVFTVDKECHKTQMNLNVTVTRTDPPVPGIIDVRSIVLVQPNPLIFFLPSFYSRALSLQSCWKAVLTLISGVPDPPAVLLWTEVSNLVMEKVVICDSDVKGCSDFYWLLSGCFHLSLSPFSPLLFLP